ncbi:hypothetical protein [Spirilliplanes yamanashiensis]|uniref:Uncharacterized protein n=1 Tax=Spirilliplanes yamanashiensis TaxID=42233 RepID=A0A8J3YCV8_9ACTN|nr:hypothetical protein [Spirilliplanes yamanashiensis]MDP9816123.1 hypothetical protein [Spirilliplanes yamanashiensis]GIJ05645.1 hypothetical protein Sya03_49970 [Spirilliplanes yamanashiensis]
MPEYPGLVLPSYHEHYGAPVKILATPDGGMVVWRASSETGAWERRDDLAGDVLFARGEDSYVRTPQAFVETTEQWRARWKVADGAVAALYETADALRATARDEGRALTPAEVALIRGIWRRTYRMVEERLRAEGNPAADPDLLEREGGAA